MKKLFLVLNLLAVLQISCYNRTINAYSKDNSQSIRIKRDAIKINVKIFQMLDGRQKNEIGHISFDTRMVDELEQALFICWKKDGYDMSILCPKAVIFENTLDSSLYKITTAYQLDDKGVPLVSRCSSEGCFDLAITEGKVFFRGDVIIEE